MVMNGDFYRVVNHSAWLFHCCIARHKVMRKYIKSMQQYVYMLGFPKQSFQRNVEDRRITKTEYGYDVELRTDEIPDESGYEVWKRTVATEAASTLDFNSLPLAGADAEREVIRRLKECRLETMTFVRCAEFIAQLRELLDNK